MSDDDMLTALVNVSRGRPQQKRLVCPTCRGDVVLRDGVLRCVCGGEFLSLQYLVLR